MCTARVHANSVTAGATVHGVKSGCYGGNVHSVLTVLITNANVHSVLERVTVHNVPGGNVQATTKHLSVVIVDAQSVSMVLLSMVSQQVLMCKMSNKCSCTMCHSR